MIIAPTIADLQCSINEIGVSVLLTNPLSPLTPVHPDNFAHEWLLFMYLALIIVLTSLGRN
jgi:hypothetical protein